MYIHIYTYLHKYIIISLSWFPETTYRMHYISLSFSYI